MTEKNSTIKERVLYFAKLKGITKDKFCQDIDMTYGNFKGKAKYTPLNSDAIAKILTLYDDVNLDWLIGGNGNPVKEIVPEILTKADENKYFVDKITKLSEELGRLKGIIKTLETAAPNTSMPVIQAETQLKVADSKDQYGVTKMKQLKYRGRTKK